MGKNVIMILAVIVTVLAGWLVIQVASLDSTITSPKGGSGSETAAPADGGERVEVDTRLTIPGQDVDTSLSIQ